MFKFKNLKKGFTIQYLKKQSNYKVSTMKDSAGFTLIELLIYMAMFSIIVIVTLQMFGAVFDAQIESEATSSVASDGRFILSRFSYDVERAQGINSPTPAGASATSLSLVIGGTTFTYSVSDGNIILSNSSTGTSDQLNGEGSTVSNAQFTRIAGADGKDLVQFSFTLTSVASLRTKTEVQNFETIAGLR